MTAEFSLTPYQIILGILASAPKGLTSAEIAAATDTPSYTISSRLSKMLSRGLLEQTKSGGKARWRLPLSEPHQVVGNKTAADESHDERRGHDGHNNVEDEVAHLTCSVQR